MSDDERLSLRELTDASRDVVLSLGIPPHHERVVSSVADSLEQAQQYPQANPWYRAVYVGDETVGFVIRSWNYVPRPPEIIGPWFLWKLLIEQQHQRCGYGREVVQMVAELVREAGAKELFGATCRVEIGGQRPFYERVGFVPTGDVDVTSELILRLDLRPHETLDSCRTPRAQGLSI